MKTDELKALAVAALEDVKGNEITVLDVKKLTSVMDWMIVVSGTSSRHVKALADSVAEKSKAAGVRPLGVEGEREAEWILVDLGDVVIHVMQPTVRAFYNLEKLWDPQLETTEEVLKARMVKPARLQKR
ncbi:MAG: ribosome silencing factor [Gammaproteobacteria bacterium]|nr:ribosome silencing factor [Gammaproteobacteria bacterium]